MKKQYELTILVDDDIDQSKAVAKVKAVLDFIEAEIMTYDDEGRKRLAYAISGHDYANYHYYKLTMDAELCAKLSAWLQGNEDVLRYLLVQFSPEEKMKYELEKAITNWVEKSYGESEAEDPSWNIEALAKYLNEELELYKGEDDED